MPKISYREIPSRLERRTPFEGNSMRGEGVYVLSSLPYRGLLPYDEYDALEKAWRIQHDAYADRGERDVPAGLAYVAYSYSTPIAWVTHDGTVTVPDVKYSSTTSRQQTLCRAYLR